MQESIFRKSAIPVAIGSIIMVIIFGIAWFRDQNDVYTLTLATGSKSGQYYAFGQALSKVVSRHNPHLKIKVIESSGAVENVQLLQDNKVQLAFVQSDTNVSPSTKAVSFLFPEMFHLIARKDSGIKEIKDLEGKGIALMPQGSGSYTMFWVLSEHYQLDKTRLQTNSMMPLEAHEALNQGKVDALFRLVALGNPAVIELLQNPQLELIPIDQGAALKLNLPALEEISIPKGAYNGSVPIPQQNLPGVGVRAVLVTRKEIKQEIIFEITRILYEARNDLVKEFPQAAMINEPNNYRNLGFSFHPGALDYYNQGQPSFIVEYAEPIGLFVSVSVLFISGIWQLRLWLKGKQKNRADLYNLQLLGIIAKIQTIEDVNQLNAIRYQLLEMLEKVIIDLDKDLICSESFQSFTFPWQVALSSIHQRETLLIRKQQQKMIIVDEN
ncbi:TAXI family TRAP transporter solute-binding subunit [Crocosphaera sp. UHCC 0190]|uniref:TAXI family TRAP transporter solute-binding subunit n=1 Tax=Crocosphaera sp. UHCC 0190 TaxID=3110246 RepID=UPI002B1FBB50|nr:TAXI family TRAP transporter solute-binding subunit [Crocosphaera sp. UHCC 0190]MEA5509121.1 TAXI family TRAP transporter solute-binding subunit [Crocosphaera sp. UHCC 0190]